jgi:hypothetical protein
MKLTRTIGRGAVTALALAATVTVGAGSAAAQSSPSASCNGLGVSALAGEPGAVWAITLEIYALVKSLGLPPGVWTLCAYLAGAPGGPARERSRRRVVARPGIGLLIAGVALKEGLEAWSGEGCACTANSCCSTRPIGGAGRH